MYRHSLLRQGRMSLEIRAHKLTIQNHRPAKEHTDIEEELHDKAHIDYDRVAIVSTLQPTVLEHNTDLLVQVANPSVAALYEDALVYETGSAITASGALSAYSGAKTGRSPSDKRIVEEDSSSKDVWWGPVNKPMNPDVSVFNLSARPPTASAAFRKDLLVTLGGRRHIR